MASVNTGSGALTFKQGVKTTDSPTFASVNTGYGDNEVYKLSYQTFAWGRVNSTINQYIETMASGEWKIVTLSGEVKSYVVTVRAPSGGTYDVLSIAGDSNIQIRNIGALAGGAEIFNVPTKSDWSLWSGTVILRKR